MTEVTNKVFSLLLWLTNKQLPSSHSNAAFMLDIPNFLFEFNRWYHYHITLYNLSNVNSLPVVK